MSTSTDRIEKQTLLRAPRSRVWQALTDTQQFGAWFGARLDNGFAVGRRVTGSITIPNYEHVKFDVVVERMDAERTFAYRWHPYAVKPDTDYSPEPMTLVEFTLEDTPDGATRLTVVESGFDQLPPGRRDEAFRMNSGGWEGQLRNVQRHAEG
jgi:uncharacterized protein YndB with AHSA1/START domain